MSEIRKLGDNLTTKLLTYFTRNHIAANAIMVLLLVLGSLSFFNTTLERFPSFDPRTISVTVPYSGATPEEVEKEITRRIEESLTGISGIERVVSTATEGSGAVIIELRQFANAIDVLEAVRTAVGSIENFPPRDADQPEVLRTEIIRSVITLALRSENTGEDELRKHAEMLREELMALPNISIVDLVGTRDREIQIEINEERLRSYRLTVEEVVRLIQQSSINLTGGEIRTDSGYIILSTLEKKVRGRDFNDIVILGQPDGSIIRLGDVARIRDSFVEEPILNTVGGTSAIFIQVSAALGTAPHIVANEVKEFLTTYQTPDQFELFIWSDETWIIKNRLKLISDNAIVGCALVFLTLLLLFDLRVAFWVTLGIPVTIIGSFIFFDLMGMTTNVMVVFGFFLIIGIVVDDAIIVGENIATQRELGKTGWEAATMGARLVMGPVIIGALTTMVTFSALIPLDGALGQMFSWLPFVVIVALALSIIEAFFILPAHLSGSHTWSRWPITKIQKTASSAFQSFINHKLLPWITASAHNPLIPLLTVICLVVLAVTLVATNVVKFNAMPNMLDTTQIQLDLTMPIGTRFNETLVATEQIVKAAHTANEKTGYTAVDSVNVLIGRHKVVESLTGGQDTVPSPNLASIQLKLHTMPRRTVTVEEFKHVWLTSIDVLPGAEKIAFPTTSQQAAPRVGYALLHSNEDLLIAATNELKRRLIESGFVYEIRDSLELGKKRFEIRLNESGYAAGLTSSNLASQLRNSFHGAEVQRILRGRDEILVVVRYPFDRRTSQFDLFNERIDLPNGTQVPFSTVVDITQSQDLAQKVRINGVRAATISAFYDMAQTSSREMAQLIDREMLPSILAQYPGLEFQYHDISIDNEKLANTLKITFPISLLLIYVLIAILLKSFSQPLLALAGVPMAVVGSILMHFILGYNLTNVSIMGIVAVAGVVINDTLVLMDRYNLMRKEHPEINNADAIIEATRLRARAIFVTTITTVIALLPLLFDKHETMFFLVPMVISMIGGLLFASFGLLLFLPAVLRMVEITKSSFRLSSYVVADQN